MKPHRDNVKTCSVSVRCSRRPGRPSPNTCWIGREIRFNDGALRCFGLKEWDPAVYDCLLLAAATEFADGSFRRPLHRRERSFFLSLPVSSPDRWSDPTVKGAAEAALHACTGDFWSLQFRGSKPHPRPLYPPLPWKQCFDATMPFSDGLDSLAVSTLEDAADDRSLLKVRLGGPGCSRRARPATAVFDRVPYSVKPHGRNFSESSFRSRGFKYAIVSGVAAVLTGANEVIVPESGQGTIGLAMAVAGQELVDRRTHPMFTSAMARLLSALFGWSGRYTHPKLWDTKGEVLTAYRVSGGSDEALRATRSCWQNQRQAYLNGKWVQCGICAACLLRRCSLHAAGLVEDKGVYLFEDLASPCLRNSVSEHVQRRTDFLSQLRYGSAGIAFMRDIPNFDQRCAADDVYDDESELLSESGLGRSVEIKRRLKRLVVQHRAEWLAFVHQYPADSFIRVGAS